MPLHSSGCTACAWHPEGYLLASTSRDGTIVVLDARKQAMPVWQTRSRGPVFGCAWVPGPMPLLAACGLNSAVALMDVTVPEPAPDGTTAMAARGGGATRVLVASELPARMMLTVSCADDGSCIATSGDLVGAEGCLDPCCVPPPDMEDDEEERQEDDPDGMFSAPVRARGGRMVFTADEEEAPAPPPAPKPWAPIHLWRARAAVLNGIA
eukprot:jgi/Botrbrau1/2284/Bobra.101_2s0107.1